MCIVLSLIFFFKQKTAYEWRISDWSADVCSSDLRGTLCPKGAGLTDFIKSPNRLKYPEYRAPGSDKWQRISWDDAPDQIGRASCRERECQYVSISVVAVSLTNKNMKHTTRFENQHNTNETRLNTYTHS